MAMIDCKECGNEVSNNSTKCPKCGVVILNKTKIGCLIIASILLLIWAIIVVTAGLTLRESIHEVIFPKEDPLKKAAIHLTKLKYKTGSFNSFMKANFTIHNNGFSDIKDIEIKCSHYSKSKTLIDSNTRTIYEIVEARKQKQFLKFDMGFIHSQSDSTICEIIDLKVL